MRKRVRVRVPATTANLGSGFDVVGLALDLYNEIDVAVAARPAVEVNGLDVDSIPRDHTNYVVVGARSVFDSAGVDAPELAIRIEQRVPVASGLGSSAAALVGGAVAANALIGGAVDDGTIVSALAKIEGHAEQVGAGVLGGALAAIVHGDDVVLLPLPVHEDLRFSVVTPATRISTRDARAVLPAHVRFGDAVTQAASAFALGPALATADAALLAVGTRDALHQSPRAALLPSAPAVLAAAVDAGALASCWSGAGPTMLAISTGDPTATRVADAMREAFLRDGLDSTARVCRPADGATVVISE